MVHKLQGLGILGKEAKWFHSYLTGGKQRVRWDGEYSDYISVRFGVRQGSILGPLLFLTLIHDLPEAINASPEETAGYADNVSLWCAGDNVEEVKALLEEKAAALVEYASKNFLVLNPEKTQLMWSSGSSTKVRVGDTLMEPSSEIELQGVKFGAGLTLNPHLKSVAKNARMISGIVARLARHIPRGSYLQQLARGLLIGKVGYAVGAVASPRFGDADAPKVTKESKAIQTAINDTARTILGARRTDRIRVEDLLARSGLPAYNHLVIRSIAMETWKALNICDGPNGSHNPIGCMLRNEGTRSKHTRRVESGKLPPP